MFMNTKNKFSPFRKAIKKSPAIVKKPNALNFIVTALIREKYAMKNANAMTVKIFLMAKKENKLLKHYRQKLN